MSGFDYRKIGENIKRLRAGKGLTQAVFAELLDISIGYLSEIETGRQMPSSKKLFKMMELLECTPNEMILGDDQPKVYIRDKDENSIDNLEDTMKSVIEMMKILNLNNRRYFTKDYLNPSVKQGLVEPLYPDQPKHPKQKYRLTAQGRALLQDGENFASQSNPKEFHE